MSNKPVTEALKKALADSYALYLKTQNFHWNVTGPHFKPLHELFEEQYTDLAAAIDEIAEQIRSLGEKAPGTMKAFGALARIPDGDETADAADMVSELAEDQKRISKTLTAVLNAAQNAEDEVTADLMIQRLAVHRKNKWMLESSL